MGGGDPKKDLCILVSPSDFFPLAVSESGRPSVHLKAEHQLIVRGQAPLTINRASTYFIQARIPTIKNTRFKARATHGIHCLS